MQDELVLVKVNDINLEFVATSFVTELKKKEMVSSTQLANFYNDAINIILNVIKQLNSEGCTNHELKLYSEKI